MNMKNNDINSSKRLRLLLLWSVSTLTLVYISLIIGIMIFGEEAGSNLFIGNIYTMLPAIMAILFIIIFKTDNLECIWNQFNNPGIKWLLFGLAYTFVVLFLTIITGLILGELKLNENYTPFQGELENFGTNIQMLDIIFYIIFVGILLIFSPGGFIRVIGEEIGWRGYLLPEFIKLRPKISVLISSILIGFIWFIYHLPYFTILAPVSSENLLYFIIGSAGVFFGASWAMMWAYLKTKSIWPALSLHFLWNLISPVFTGNIYSKSLGLLNPTLDNIWLVNGEGLIGGFYHFIVGLVFLILILKNEDDLIHNYNRLGELDSNITEMKKMRIRK